MISTFSESKKMADAIFWSALFMALLNIGWLPSAGAADGAREINQQCATNPRAGCFTGDSPGFPVNIQEAGSYVLTSNLNTGDQDTSALWINPPMAGSRVNINLNGFTIKGGVPCSGKGATLKCPPHRGMFGGLAIVASGDNMGLSVRNGSIIGFSAYGVYQARDDSKLNIEGVQVSDINGVGVSAQGYAIVTNSLITRNGSGLELRGGGVISNNVVSDNKDFGIRQNSGATITNNKIAGNGGDGIDSAEGGMISSNTISDNGRNGIAARKRGLVTGNTVSNNTEWQLQADDASVGYSNNVFAFDCFISTAGGVLGGSSIGQMPDGKSLLTSYFSRMEDCPENYSKRTK